MTVTWAANGNSADTAYRLDLSTASDFSGTLYSSTTLGVSATVSGLSASTPYFARVATTADGVFTALGSTTTTAAAQSLTGAAFTSVATTSLTANWASTYPGGTLYYARLSTNSSFAAPVASSNTFTLSAAFSGLTPNTTYYAQVATAPAGPFTSLGNTVALMQPPTSVYFDEISTHSIVASAYAPTPAFSNLGAGLSGTNLAKDGAYAGWRGERWTTMASMPAARYALKAATVNGRIYAIGGYNGGNLSTNAEFDPAANAWTTKTAMPTARHSFYIGAVDGKVYAMGGESSSVLSTHQTYDPATNAWTTKASLPAAQSQGPTAVHGGRLHLFGGFTTQTVATQRVYDPPSDSWTTKADLPTPRNAAAVEVVDGRSYVIGGATGSVALAVHEAYDPTTDSWSTRATMPTPRSLAYVGQVGGKVYVIGGEIGFHPGSAATEEYDPAADTWTARAPFPTPRRWGGSATVNGKIYALGGGNGTTLATNEEYDPGVAHVFSGLQPNTLYSFKAKARNLAGIETAESASFSTYTLAAVPAAATPTFTGAFLSSVTLAWTANGNPVVTGYRLQASTAANFNGAASSVTSSWGAALVASVPGLTPNATWYFRVQARNAFGVETAFASLGSTVTQTQSPTAVAFDEISSHSIVASAYAPTPAFSNLNVGLSGTNLAKDGAYAGWHGESWTSRAAMPTARSGLAVGAIGGKLYAVGGYNGTAAIAANEEYDPAANVWTTKAAMPSPRREAAAGVVGDKLYVVGGSSGAYLAKNEAYDPATNSWATKAAMPTARGFLSAVVLDGRLYAVGGTNVSDSAANEAYDPAADAWATKAPMPAARREFGAGAVGGKLYAVGGWNGVTNYDTNEEYSPSADAWTAKPALPAARRALTVGTLGGKLYAIGGYVTASTTTVEEYDPQSGSWTTRAPMPTARHLPGAAAVAGKIYVLGGYNASPSAANEAYDPGVAQQFTGLQPNTQYTFKAKARNLAGIETAESASFSTYTWAAVPTAATPTFTAVFTSSVAVAWTANGNPGGTEYRLYASTAPDFNGAASSVTAGWMTALSTALSPLPPATWYFRIQARNAVGVETAFASLGSTRTRFADVPGCATSLFVQKAGGADCTAIQVCVGLVPSSLSGDACVVVSDSATYSESVVVQNKAPNGFRVRLFAADGARPVLNPPAGSAAGLRILNASVTVSGLAVVTTNTVAYGILVSSPQVTLSSISVDSGGKISGAGIFLSSAAALSYSSVTVQNADGVRVTGSSNTISFTTASVTAFSRGAFYLNGAFATVLEDSVGTGNPGYGAFLYHAHRNTLSRNTLRKVSATAGAAGLYLNDASSNVVTGCSVSNANGTGADLAAAADWNVLEFSTVTAAGSSYDALLVGSGRGTRVSRAYAQSSAGNAASFSSGSSESLVEHSTFVAGAAGFHALGTNGSSETITGNLLLSPNGTGLGLFGSSITVSLTAAYSANSSYPTLYVSGGGYVTVRDSSFENSAGDGGKLERTVYVDVLRSTVAGAGGGAGLRLEGSSSNTVTASRLAAPGGVGLAVGSYLELFDMTTTTGAGNAFRNLAVSGSTAVSLGAAPGLELSSSVLTGDAQGSALAFGDAVLVATFTGLAFPSGAAWSAEAALLPMGSRITVRDASGAQGGSLYENDPLSLVDWVPDTVPFVLPSTPAAPSGTVLGASSIAWTWAAVPNAQSYRVYSSSSGSLLAASASTGAVVTGLLPAATHSVVVAGVARGQDGPLSASATAHTHAEPPTGLALDALFASSATLSWSLNGNPPGTPAELQRSTDGTAFSVRAGTLAATAEDAGLLGCTSYYYRVRNRNPVGVDSGFDGPLLVRTAASTPSAPGDLSAQSVPGRRVSLTWNPSATEGIVAYRLFKDSGAGSVDYSAPYAEFGPTVFSTTTVALSSGSIHLFGLRAVHRCGVTETNTHAVASAWALESLDGVRASIKVPATGKKISGNRVLVMAELDTGDARDVSSILFQYRSTGSATWTDVTAANSNHPNPDREQPFFVHWDVSALADRAYDLRAVASDVVGASDPAPGAITVLVDSVGYEVRETDLGGGKVKKEQAVSNETTNTVAAAESGSGVVTKVVLPAGALNTAGATLSVTPNPTALPAPPAAATSLGAALEVTLSNGQSQLSGGQTAAIVFNYPDDDGDGVIDGTQIRAEHAQIQTFDVATNKWKQEFATVVDKDKRTLTGQTPHFSLFAAFGVVQANLDAIRVYPNPYKPNGGNADEGRPFSRADPLSGVIFDNLPAVVEISIYTLTGRLVSTFGTSAGTGAVQWDGKNDQGEDVASGGYFAVIKSPGAAPVIKKIGVIR